ncbi:hypothetical protein BBJ28_00010811 [Nothophytophthora sp. Chile5]|nr:hypothetical protein BBJ28_00010811 [Nothophytophthora sp. Chile5]
MQQILICLLVSIPEFPVILPNEGAPPRGVKSNSGSTITAFDETKKAAASKLKPNHIMYSTILMALLQPFQSGWSTSQLYQSQFSDTDGCNARPVADDTYLKFPGHSKLVWTFAVNA